MKTTHGKWGALLVLFAAFAASSLLALTLRAAPVQAFEPSVWTPEEERIFNSLQKQSNAADLLRAKGQAPSPEVEDAQKVARRVLTRATRKAIPRLAPHLVTKAGLAGVAAGVWIHNGVAIYNGYQCGRTDCPEPLVLDAEFRQATEEAAALGAGNSVFKSYGPDNFLVATGMVTAIDYQWDPASYTCSLKVSVAVQRAPGSQGYNIQGPGKNRPDSSPFGSTLCDVGPMNLGGTLDGEATIEAKRQTFTAVPATDIGQFAQMFTVEPFTGDFKRFGPRIYPYLNSTWKNPVYDVGKSEVRRGAPADSDLRATLDEGKALVDAARGDEEYKQEWAKPWLEPGFKLPRDPAEVERLFGPVIEEWIREVDSAVCKKHQYGTVICTKLDGEVAVYVYPDEIAWVEYPDGTKQWIIHPNDALQTAHPWGPLWKPEPGVPGIKPPGTNPGDERIFGPMRRIVPPEPGHNTEWTFFADGTVRADDMASTGRAYINDGRVIWYHYPPGGPPQYQHLGPDNEIYKIGDCMGRSYTITYADGTVRERVVPSGTPESRFAEATPICERWWDASGNQISEPANSAAYPVTPFKVPPPPPGHTGYWPS